jgi:hypothetical protein
MTVEEHRDPLSSEVKPREGTVGPHPPDIQVQTPRLLRVWQVTAFALAIAATCWVVTGFVYSPRVAASDVQDVLGYVREIAHFKSLPAHRIARFEPHSPLPPAGVEVGDLIVDPPRGALLPGESVQLQIRNDCLSATPRCRGSSNRVCTSPSRYRRSQYLSCGTSWAVERSVRRCVRRIRTRGSSVFRPHV